MPVSIEQLRIAYKNPCRFATTGTVSLTGSSAIDGSQTLNDYDRILVKDHLTSAFNGIWIATSSAWFRSLDFNNETEDLIGAGVFTYIQDGLTNRSKTFHLTTTASITLDTTSLTFQELAPSTTITYFNSTTAGSIFTTGSMAFKGAEVGIDSPIDKGTDAFFYVSGSKGSKGTAIAGAALFGGDVVSSGSFYVMSGSNVIMSGTAGYQLNILSSSANININWSLGNKATVTMGHNITFTFTDPPGACSLQLILKQDSTGSRTPSFPASVAWANAVTGTISTGSNSVDIVSFLYDGSIYFGMMGNNFATV